MAAMPAGARTMRPAARQPADCRRSESGRPQTIGQPTRRVSDFHAIRAGGEQDHRRHGDTAMPR